MACVMRSVSGCIAQTYCTLEDLRRPSAATAARSGRQRLGFSSCRRLKGFQSQETCRRGGNLGIYAVAEKTEESQTEPVFKLKIENDEDDAPAAPRWTGLVEKDTAGQTNIYSVEPTVYVADSLLSTNSQGPGGSSSNTVAFIGTALVFTALAIGSAVNISQYKASEQAAGGAVGVEYSGPPLSFYIEKFSAATVAPVLEAPSLTDAPAAPEEVVAPSEPLAAIVTEEAAALPEVEEAAPEVVDPEAVVDEPSVEAEAAVEEVLPNLEEGVQTAALVSEESAGEIAAIESAAAPSEEPAVVVVAEV